jgi:predicted transcriptional regulator
MKKSILASTPFFIMNKYFLLKLGIDASLVLSDLIQKEQYFKESCQDNDGFFFNVTNDISCSTTLSYYQIKQALSILEKWNIIKVVLKGVPAKKHFKIDHNQISNFLRTSNEKNEELECQNFNNKIVNSLNSINNNKEIKIKKNNINTRRVKFLNDLKELEPKDYIEDFLDYWTEENNAGKQRWELEKTWNTNLRYKRWVRNQKNFSRGNNANNMPDFLDSAYLNRIKEDQAQVNKFYKHLVENCGYERVETATGYIRYRKRV